jgi:hypothetical protein
MGSATSSANAAVRRSADPMRGRSVGNPVIVLP